MIHNETIVRPLYVDSYVPGTAAAPGDDGQLPPLLAAAPGDDGQLLPLPEATPGDDRLSCPPLLYARHPNPKELSPVFLIRIRMDPNLFGCPGSESVLGMRI